MKRLRTRAGLVGVDQVLDRFDLYSREFAGFVATAWNQALSEAFEFARDYLRIVCGEPADEECTSLREPVEIGGRRRSRALGCQETTSRRPAGIRNCRDAVVRSDSLAITRGPRYGARGVDLGGHGSACTTARSSIGSRSTR